MQLQAVAAFMRRYGFAYHALFRSPGTARALSTTKASTSASQSESPGNSLLGALGIKMYPDLADANERELAKSFSSMGKVLSLYRRPRTREEHGLIPYLEDWSYYAWNRLDTMRICKQSILGFSRTSLLEHASSVFRLVHAATATGNPQLLDKLKELVAPRMYEQIRADAHVLQQHRRGPKGRQKGKGGMDVGQPIWQLDNIVSAEIVDAADANPIPEDMLKQIDSKLRCAQITVRFVTQQRGPGQQQQQVTQTFEDFWVLERPFYKSLIFRKPGPYGATWRLLAQLNVSEYAPMTGTAEDDTAAKVTHERLEKILLGATSLGAVGLLSYGLYSLFFLG